MKLLKFEGSLAQIAKKEAEFYKRNGLVFRKRISASLLRKQKAIYERYYPEMIEKCNIIAEVLGQKKNNVLACFITSEQQIGEKKRQTGCSIWGIRNKNGCFIGRNYDWLPNAEKFFYPYKVCKRGKNAYVAVSDMWTLPASKKPFIFEPEDLINEKGLYLGLTWANDKKWNYGLLPTHLMVLISESCSTVKQALNVFAKVPLAVPKNFFIGDIKEELAVVEHTSRKHKVIRPQDGILIQTNDYVDKELAEEDAVLKDNPGSDTYIRYYEILQYLKTKGDSVKFNDIGRFMNKKKTYVFESKKDLHTIWTLAIDIRRRRYKMYYHQDGTLKSKLLKI